MLSQTIRREFLQYFKSKGHAIVPSSPVVPQDDPTLLFANAGMNQFKDVFLGNSKRDYTKATTSQKCIRVGGKHNDLDNVGHTSRHLTFFEMLGNFSFGDYFKKEAIAYAWDVANHVFALDPEKIWVSVYKDDDEAFELWTKHISPKRIVRFGEKENFWAMGDTGPCGPCSELLYDRGETFGKAKNPHDDVSGERYFEFWNLVFMQYMRDASGTMTPLPKQSIDTGAGLERVVSLRMGVDNVFLTDVLRSLIARVEEISHTKYDPAHPNPAFHVIADHIRSLAFAIADGAVPSNVDRGYVLRKILRRAVRYGRMLQLQRPFLADLLPRLLETMGDDYPELKKSSSHIAELLTIEEESFIRTLQRGGNLLAQSIEGSRSKGVIGGDDAFKLKDTYGFPLEEILLIAKDENLQVDLPRFVQLEEEAKEKSRKSRKVAAQQFEENFFRDFTEKHPPSQFVGYSQMNSESRITGLSIGEKFVDELSEGDEGFLILDTTPFYAEMGGQVGDTGQISHAGALFQVEDCLSPYPGVIVHLGKVIRGKFKKSEHVKASVDETRRLEIQNNHTATHLLHWALQKVLGSHIKQAGSLVDEKRLRFDFSHHKALSLEELREIEQLVNEKIREDRPVHTYELSFEEAQKRSDIKQFFGEKYGNKVRVIDIDFSKELCGGTHTQRTGSIGYFKIAKESSIAAGSRRIEAVTGKRAEELILSTEDLLQKIAGLVKAPLTGVLEKIEQLIEENKSLSQEIKIVRQHQLKELASKMLHAHKEHVGEIALIAQEVALPLEELTPFAEELMRVLKSGVIVLGAKIGGRCQLLVQVSPDLVHRKVLATSLVREAAPLIQGGGGGRDMLAQAGGKDPLGLPNAFSKIKELLKLC
jgi:alanyl-tRNA synthetase